MRSDPSSVISMEIKRSNLNHTKRKIKPTLYSFERKKKRRKEKTKSKNKRTNGDSFVYNGSSTWRASSSSTTITMHIGPDESIGKFIEALNGEDVSFFLWKWSNWEIKGLIKITIESWIKKKNRLTLSRNWIDFFWTLTNHRSKQC
jgi:hypothetical protein